MSNLNLKGVWIPIEILTDNKTSTSEDAQLIISGPEENREILTNIIATKSNNSNIKGE